MDIEGINKELGGGLERKKLVNKGRVSVALSCQHRRGHVGGRGDVGVGWSRRINPGIRSRPYTGAGLKLGQLHVLNFSAVVFLILELFSSISE